MGENHARRDRWLARLTGMPSMPLDCCCCNPATTGCIRATGGPPGGRLNEIASCWLWNVAILFGQNGPRVLGYAVLECPETRESIVSVESVESSLQPRIGSAARWLPTLKTETRRLLQSKMFGFGARSRIGRVAGRVATFLCALSCLSCGGDGGHCHCATSGTVVIDVPSSTLERGTRRKFSATVNDVHGTVGRPCRVGEQRRTRRGL